MRDHRDFLLHRIVRALREPVQFGSGFDARVMRAVRGLPRHTRDTLWSRLTTPRTITVTPLSWGLLAASVLVIAAYGAVRSYVGSNRAGAESTRSAAGTHDTLRRVQFVLVAPTARKVAVVGDFNGWDASHVQYQAMHRGGGVWSVTAPIPTGHHRYSFIVDDSVWVADPQAPRAIDKDFGLTNSAIVVGEQEQ
jgi:hypothetical protein